MKTTTIHRGDTLSGLARKNHTTVDALVKANKIKNPDKILAGAKLVVPGRQDVFTPAATKAPPGNTSAPAARPPAPAAPTAPATPSAPSAPATPSGQQTAPRGGDVFESKPPQAPRTAPAATPRETPAASTTEFVKDGRKFPTSNGYPVYAQGANAQGVREPWADKSAGAGKMSGFGCAVTAVTMGINGITGKTVTPGDMADHVSRKGGFSKAGVAWGTMGSAVNPAVQVNRTKSGFDANAIDKELNAGRPVAVHVDYHTGRGTNSKSGYDNVGDHWILVTGRTKDGGYVANDPAGGKTITLHRQGNQLVADEHGDKFSTPYKTTGGAVTFDRGPSRPSTPATQPAPSRPSTPATQPAPSRPSTPVASTGGQGNTPATSGTSQPNTSSTRANNLSGDWKADPGFDANRYDSIIRDAASRHGVSPRLVKAIIQQESHFDPKAGSQVGAKGLMQFMPKTWESAQIGGGDIHDPKTNINAGAKYLGYLLKKFKGDVPTALAAYNHGEGNVGKNLARNDGKLNISELPKETRGYIRNITASYEGTSYR